MICNTFCHNSNTKMILQGYCNKLVILSYFHGKVKA